jgi:hypothetical protein
MRLPHLTIALSLALSGLAGPPLAQDAKTPPATEFNSDVGFVSGPAWE